MATTNTSYGSTLQVLVMYKECHHNHAAQARGYVLDGCGLFEPTGPSGTPQSTVCAACGCHRSFHRRVKVDLPSRNDTRSENETETEMKMKTPPTSIMGWGSFLLHSQSHTPSPALSPAQETEEAGRRKRITKEQSERIRVVAESNNWKTFREYSEEEIGRICSDIGITRMALKGWIFNHRRKRATRNAAHN